MTLYGVTQTDITMSFSYRDATLDDLPPRSSPSTTRPSRRARSRPTSTRSCCARRSLDTALSLDVDTVLGFIFGHNELSMKLKLFAGFGFDAWGMLPRVAVLDGVERDLVILSLRLDVQRAAAAAA